MRSIPETLRRKVASRIQTGENGMSASLWVGRPTTPLVDPDYLEKQVILQSGNITKTSVAVCHPHLSKSATHVYFAYIESGEIRVIRTSYKDIMEDHEWEPVEFSKFADDVSLCFDGTMPKSPSSWVELKTDTIPWVFWCKDGALYGCKLDAPDQTIILAPAGCFAVSAVRAMWSANNVFDFGLVVFFLLQNNLYYRQLIGGVWMDAELVSAGPSEMLWQDLAAFRTWDYRVGVQLKSTTGRIYELFTQFMGIGKQNVDYVEVSRIKALTELIPIKYHDTLSHDNVALSSVTAGAPYGGLYSLDVPKMIVASNLNDGNGDWGKIVSIDFDNYLVAQQVAENHANFALVDSNGDCFTPMSAILSESGLTVDLEFMDFNEAYGLCEIQYNPGTLHSMAGTQVEFTSRHFYPILLNPTGNPLPRVESIWNA